MALTSIWLVYPWFAGPLGLLRDFWSWTMLCSVALLCLRQRSAEAVLLPLLAWSLLLAAVANSTQGLMQAIQLWRHTGVSDVYGFLHQRNQLASLCLMGLLAAAWLAAKPGHASATRVRRAMVLGSAVLLGAALSLSGSRTGLVGVGLLWLAAEALAHSAGHAPYPTVLRRALRLALLGYGLALLPVLGGAGAPTVGILARQEAQEGLSVCSSRVSLWANVLQLIGERPWSGWGWGQLEYAHFITLFRTERFCALLGNAHNLPLHLAVELGVPIALLVCALAAWGVGLGQPWRERHTDRLFAWAVLATIGLHSLLEYPLWYGPFQVSALLCLWVLWRTPRQLGEQPAAYSTPLSRRVTLSLRWTLALGLVAVLGAAADYYRASQIYLPPTARLGVYRGDTQTLVQKSVVFQNLIDFANLGLTEVSASNAAQTHSLALQMLHFSPEAMVVQKLLTSAQLLGLQAEYDFYQPRFAAAYPEVFVAWKTSQPAQ